MSNSQVFEVFELFELRTQEQRNAMLFQGNCPQFNYEEQSQYSTLTTHNTLIQSEEGDKFAELEYAP